jgi:hypothetical protein
MDIHVRERDVQIAAQNKRVPADVTLCRETRRAIRGSASSPGKSLPPFGT